MYNIIKKIGHFLFVVFTLQIFILNFSFANNVDNINIDVNVKNDGSATITQVWHGEFNEGTENYIPINTGDISINNFKVKMNDVLFDTVPYWDINSSFYEKQYKAGINYTNNGIELCFGISNYGENTYVFTYDVKGFVKSYNDKDGFNFMFVNPNMSTFPTNVKWCLHLDNGISLNSDVAKIWGFGFDGNTSFADNRAIAETTQKLFDGNYFIIMMNFEKGLLNPSISVNDSFENVKNKAFVNSDYQEYIDNYNNKTFDIFKIIFFLSFFGIIAAVIINLISNIRNHFSLKKLYKECDYYRDVPNNGNIAMSYVLSKDFDLWGMAENNIIGALIMKMIYDKNLEAIEEKNTGFFGIEKVSTSLKIVSEPFDEITKKLYNIIVNACGSDMILQEKELEKYATKHYKELNDFIEAAKNIGHNVLSNEKCYRKAISKKMNCLSDEGINELSEVYGFRKYLDEYSLIAEREVKEIDIWDNYLIYATLFGIAKKVLKDLKKVYPNNIIDIEKYSRQIYISDTYNMILYRNAMRGYRMSNASKMTSATISGLGGHTSFGGGGGFSGGGFGGGSR